MIGVGGADALMRISEERRFFIDSGTSFFRLLQTRTKGELKECVGKSENYGPCLVISYSTALF